VITEFILAEGIDLVVMGTMGRTGIAWRLVGNTAERVLQRSPCSVLAVKPDELCRAGSELTRPTSSQVGGQRTT
jgi:hypothetical protein